MRLLALLALTTCASPSTPALFPAGTDRDEGHGELARASTQLTTGEDESDDQRGTAETLDEGRVGKYGGVSYANYQPPPWGYPIANRNPTHEVQANLTGSIEGTVAWRGPVPTAKTACGAVEWLTVGPKRELAGAIVYIEKLTVGRALTAASSDQRPATVGAVIVKRGCALRPVASIVTPVPARVTIAGDATASKLRIQPEGSLPRPVELEANGRVATEIKSGVTRIDAVDGTVGSAWALGLTTPAYAMTDDAGRYRLDELAPGSYTVTVWVPPPPTVRAGMIVYAEPIVVQRVVKVSGAAKLDVAVGK